MRAKGASPALSIEVACEEALALEREFARGKDTIACQARAVPLSPMPTPPALNIEQIKEVLRTELRQEIEEQVALLGKTITEELRGQVSALCNPSRSGLNDRRPATSRNDRTFQWDEQGRPVCKDCGDVGHIQRFCPRRRAPPPGFHVHQPL